MRYISDDNKVFETEQECLEHENKLREAESKKKLLEEERLNDLKELKTLYNKLVEKYNAFQKKNPDTEVFTGRDSWVLDDLLRLIDSGLYGFKI